MKVNAEGIFHTYSSYDYARCVGEGIVGRGGSQDDTVYFLWVGIGLFEELFHRFARHVACAKAFFVENAAFFDTNSRHDPLVVSVYHARKFVIIKYVFGDVSTYTGDNGIKFFHYRERDKSC